MDLQIEYSTHILYHIQDVRLAKISTMRTLKSWSCMESVVIIAQIGII